MSSVQVTDFQPVNPILKADDDKLGFDHKARQIAAKLRNVEGPFIAGVFGPWGSGKTSFCNLIAEHLKKDEDEEYIRKMLGKPARAKKQSVFKYNAWRYENDQHPLVPLLQCLAEDRTVQDWLGVAGQTLKSLASALTINLGIGKFDASKAIKQTAEEKKNNPTVQQGFDNLALASGAFSKHLDCLRKQLIRKRDLKNGKQLYILVDDLDRCSPEKALDLLEKIKVILDLPQCVFVLALNEKALDGYIRKRYADNYGEDFSITEYLEKLVQLKVIIPDTKESLSGILGEKLQGIWGDTNSEKWQKLISLVQKGAHDNPRSATRILNQLINAGMRDWDEDKVTAKTFEEILSVFAPRFLKELKSSQMTRDYLRSVIALKDDKENGNNPSSNSKTPLNQKKIESIVNELTPRTHTAMVVELCNEGLPAFLKSFGPFSEVPLMTSGNSILFKGQFWKSFENRTRIIDLFSYYLSQLKKDPSYLLRILSLLEAGENEGILEILLPLMVEFRNKIEMISTRQSKDDVTWLLPFKEVFVAFSKQLESLIRAKVGDPIELSLHQLFCDSQTLTLKLLRISKKGKSENSKLEIIGFFSKHKRGMLARSREMQENHSNILPLALNILKVTSYFYMDYLSQDNSEDDHDALKKELLKLKGIVEQLAEANPALGAIYEVEDTLKKLYPPPKLHTSGT